MMSNDFNILHNQIHYIVFKYRYGASSRPSEELHPAECTLLSIMLITLKHKSGLFSPFLPACYSLIKWTLIRCAWITKSVSGGSGDLVKWRTLKQVRGFFSDQSLPHCGKADVYPTYTLHSIHSWFFVFHIRNKCTKLQKFFCYGGLDQKPSWTRWIRNSGLVIYQ